MRTLRLLVAGLFILALLGGAPTLAQDPEKATWTHVTGHGVAEERTDDILAQSWDGSVEHQPGSTVTYTMEWSDPRLPGTMLTHENIVLHHGDLTSYDDWMLMWSEAAQGEGPDGAWVETGRGFMGPDGAHGLAVLTGEGAYLGLTALFAVEPGDGTLDFDGFIFESELPPMPDVPEPPSE